MVETKEFHPPAAWSVRLTCCGCDYGRQGELTWTQADEFRESFIAAPDHDRSAIIEDAEPGQLTGWSPTAQSGRSADPGQ